MDKEQYTPCYNKINSLIYQSYVDHIVRQSNRSGVIRLFGGVYSKFLASLRSLLILLFSESLVKIRVGGGDIFLKLSHPLPLYMACNPLYDRILPEIVKDIYPDDEKAFIIDVGANVGDTAVLISQKVNNVNFLCVEGDSSYYEQLLLNFDYSNMSGVCLNEYASDSRNISLVKTVSDLGTGRLIDSGKADGSALAHRTIDEMVSEVVRFETPVLIKIDTDGFDYKVLRGASKLISTKHPAIFFEFDPNFLRNNGEEIQSIFDFLCTAGYERGIIYMNTGQLLTGFDINGRETIEMLVRLVDMKLIPYFDIFVTIDNSYVDALIRKELLTCEV